MNLFDIYLHLQSLSPICISLISFFFIVFIRDRLALISNEIFYKSIGVVGIPVHELSHFIACLACMPFGYRVQQLQLYKPSDQDTVGYLLYNYKKSLFSPICNLVIGIAPLFGGTFAFILVTKWLMPDVFDYFASSTIVANALNNDLSALYHNLVHLLGLIAFSSTGFIQTLCWLFLSYSLIVFSVPSKADLSQSKLGILYLIIFTLFLSMLLPAAYVDLVEFIIQFNAFYVAIAFLHAMLYLVTLSYCYSMDVLRVR
ncbi:hypothetical protein [Shewanella frigidimarina]|uniref:hypothetical protein n=1 Tax=Shewanella frigidimarina TaxID=56812 RepID=UPI003D796E01